MWRSFARVAGDPSIPHKVKATARFNTHIFRIFHPLLADNGEGPFTTLHLNLQYSSLQKTLPYYRKLWKDDLAKAITKRPILPIIYHTSQPSCHHCGAHSGHLSVPNSTKKQQHGTVQAAETMPGMANGWWYVWWQRDPRYLICFCLARFDLLSTAATHHLPSEDKREKKTEKTCTPLTCKDDWLQESSPHPLWLDKAALAV